MKNEIIQAILDGNVVQFNSQPPHKDSDLYWIDLNVKDNPNLYSVLFTDSKYPRFRIKPETQKIQVKLALMRNSAFYVLAVNSSSDVIELEENSLFVKWLTDWIIYEIGT